MDKKASDLASVSRKYRDEARQLEARSTLIKVGLVLGLVLLAFLLIRFFLF